MFTPPAEVSAVLAAFAPLFTEPSWLRAQVLLCGTLLAPANHTLTAALRALRLDAALYAPAPVRQPGQRGRSRLKGKRLPKLAQRLEQAHTPWRRHRLVWYGGQWRWLEL